MQFNPLNMNQPYTKSNIIIPTISTIPRLPPLNINYILNENTLSLNTNNSINTNENMDSLTLNRIEQEIQNGIKQYIHSDIQKANNNKLKFNFKKRRKIKKKKTFDKLSVKYINKSLHCLHKEINKYQQKQLIGKYNMNTSITTVKGSLNGYVKFSKYSKPMNLKMMRDTRNNRNIQQSLKQIKSIKHCIIGDKIVIINKLHRENKEITQYQTDIMQIKGVISDVFYDYINVIIPIDFERKQFIQRKIYAFDMKNEEYGAVYKASK